MGKIDTKLEKEPVINEELKQSNDVEQPKAPTDGENGSQVTPNAEETVTKSEEQKQETQPETQSEVGHNDTDDDIKDEIVQELTKAEIIHVVEYTGHGAWVDSTGKTWARKSNNQNIITSAQFTNDEFASRDDLQFMIKYGEMSHTIVNI